MKRPDFKGDEPCTQIGTDWYFPAVGQASSKAFLKVREACGRCPMREQCLEYSLFHERYGVWGGLGAVERAKLRSERGITIHTPETVDSEVFLTDTTSIKRHRERRAVKEMSS